MKLPSLQNSLKAVEPQFNVVLVYNAGIPKSIVSGHLGDIFQWHLIFVVA